VKVTPKETTKVLEKFIRMNNTFLKTGRGHKRKSVVLWGVAGLGKTDLVKQLGDVEIDGKYPTVVHIPSAQIEEAGDILGLPEKSADGKTTEYLPPAWWPSEERFGTAPVVLLIDDFNRADPRILNALMQVIQDKKSISAKLAPNTSIILTGNEANHSDQYTVNEVDKAFLTRLFHLELKFDAADWADWANRNGIDERVVTWVLAYPELVDGSSGTRTNPRSVTDFADSLSLVSDLELDKDYVSVLANGYLDEIQVASFLKFVTGDFTQLVSPEEILTGWKLAEKKLKALKKRGDGKKLRADIMSLTAQRLYLYLTNPNNTLDSTHLDNFTKYLQCEVAVTSDVMFMLLRRLNHSDNPNREAFVAAISRADKELQDILLKVV
jgi:MoxR-like ATPase